MAQTSSDMRIDNKAERKAMKQKNKASKLDKKSKSMYAMKTFVNKH